MSSPSLLSLAFALVSTGSVLFASAAVAETPLNRATVQRLRNQVEVALKQQPKRQARTLDVLTPGDALTTFRQAMAELRFNDNSLARIGEQAIFQFEPNTRNFQLNRGTILLLIPPGQGRTRVRTPNAAAGIRGSALFVRYIEDSNVTMVGALTNSDIEISNQDGTQTVVLKAGQMGYVYQNKIGVYNFDQKTFQETSPLFKELNWKEAPTEVQQEIEQALSGQSSLVGKAEENPDWTKLAENRTASAQPQIAQKTSPLDSTPLGTPLFDRLEKELYPTAKVGAVTPVSTPTVLAAPVNQLQPASSSPPAASPAPLPTSQPSRPEPTNAIPAAPAPVAAPLTTVITAPPATAVVTTPVTTPVVTAPVTTPVVTPTTPPATPPTPTTISVPQTSQVPTTATPTTRPAPAPLPSTTPTTTVVAPITPAVTPTVVIPPTVPTATTPAGTTPAGTTTAVTTPVVTTPVVTTPAATTPVVTTPAVTTTTPAATTTTPATLPPATTTP